MTDRSCSDRENAPYPGDKYRLRLRYDGTRFHGWQMQKDLPTVQEALENAVEECFQNRVPVFGASRTDAGVHALGQAAHLRIDTDRPTSTIQSGLNNFLPEDVVVQDVEAVPDHFHAITDTTAKTYTYLMVNRRSPPALLRDYLNWVPSSLDFEVMEETASIFEDTRNFRAFATDADEVNDPVCAVYSVELTRNSPYIVFQVTGERFLYNMVRTMVGTLIEAGKGNTDPALVEKVLEAGDRTRAAPVAEAAGLYLRWVHYRKPVPYDDYNISGPGDVLFPTGNRTG